MATNLIPGVSTLGVTFGFGIETTAGVQPTTFTALNRINQIGSINIETETIDASALEDVVESAVAGRGSSGGSFPVTVNITDKTIAEWEDLISKYQTAKAAGKSTWFITIIPSVSKIFAVVGEPPSMIPQPEFAQNGLLTVEMPITINTYKGPINKGSITLSENTAGNQS